MTREVRHHKCPARTPGPSSLDRRATHGQLEEELRKYGITGSTHRKAVRFFLAAASYANLPLSPLFKAPSASSPGERRTRKPKVKPSDVSDQPALDDKTKKTKASDLHPFVQGLVGSLPEPGAPLPADKQEAWFETARGIFKLVHETDAPPGRRQDSSTGGGEPG